MWADTRAFKLGLLLADESCAQRIGLRGDDSTLGFKLAIVGHLRASQLPSRRDEVPAEKQYESTKTRVNIHTGCVHRKRQRLP
jgi:hypothetical protein